MTMTTERKRFSVRTGNVQHIQNTRDAIRAMEPFKTGGAMEGYRGNYGLRQGHWLSPAEVAEYERVANHILYCVVSWDTVIAYAYRQMDDGTLPPKGEAGQRVMWHYVDQRFSVSTAAHQSQVRAALNGRRADYGSVWQDSPLTWETLTEIHQGVC